MLQYLRAAKNHTLSQRSKPNAERFEVGSLAVSGGFGFHGRGCGTRLDDTHARKGMEIDVTTLQPIPASFSVVFLASGSRWGATTELAGHTLLVPHIFVFAFCFFCVVGVGLWPFFRPLDCLAEKMIITRGLCLLPQLQPVRGCCERWALRAELNKTRFAAQQSQPTALD